MHLLNSCKFFPSFSFQIVVEHHSSFIDLFLCWFQLTPKEAFRMISHKFHGKGPGKMKQEKRMKQYQEELKMKQMKSSDTPSLSVERMREAQARLQTPYLVLSGHVKPGYVFNFMQTNNSWSFNLKSVYEMKWETWSMYRFVIYS